MDLFFKKGLLSSKRVLHKNEENKSCRKTSDLQIRLCSFLVLDSSKEATDFANKGPKFPRSPKLEALTVVERQFRKLSTFFELYSSLFHFWVDMKACNCSCCCQKHKHEQRPQNQNKTISKNRIRQRKKGETDLNYQY